MSHLEIRATSRAPFAIYVQRRLKHNQRGMARVLTFTHDTDGATVRLTGGTYILSWVFVGPPQARIRYSVYHDSEEIVSFMGRLSDGIHLGQVDIRVLAHFRREGRFGLRPSETVSLPRRTK